ncbi:hypothetical protein FB451DRAFT_1215013 [Mycena latifolia]|nr:hypothetical protein FB451DRAFT_1215013 [Mycena latifolia]
MGAFPGGPWASSETSRPSAGPRSYAPPAPGLHWGDSSYACILPEVDNAPPDQHQRAGHGAPRLAGIPDAQPHRVRPIALPPQIEGITHVALHPALAHSRAPLPVDFASMPTTESNAAWHPLFAEAATYPGLPSLTVISPRLPWVITAHASGRTLRCVTVADVLGAICEALRLHVDKEPFADWATMTQRGSHCPRRAMEGGITYRHGMTRLDLLEGKTKFAGLVVNAMGCDIWTLEVA